MNFLVDLIKGVFVGIANVIPGVSGGTMAVSFGIYDKLLKAISSLLKSFKKSFLTLLPIILGMVLELLVLLISFRGCLQTFHLQLPVHLQG